MSSSIKCSGGGLIETRSGAVLVARGVCRGWSRAELMMVGPSSLVQAAGVCELAGDWVSKPAPAVSGETVKYQVCPARHGWWIASPQGRERSPRPPFLTAILMTGSGTTSWCAAV